MFVSVSILITQVESIRGISDKSMDNPPDWPLIDQSASSSTDHGESRTFPLENIVNAYPQNWTNMLDNGWNNYTERINTLGVFRFHEMQNYMCRCTLTTDLSEFRGGSVAHIYNDLWDIESPTTRIDSNIEVWTVKSYIAGTFIHFANCYHLPSAFAS